MAFQPPVSLHRRIQELLLGFSRGISATLSVSGALDALSSEVNALFGTRRVSVWIHDRRARELALAAYGWTARSSRYRQTTAPACWWRRSGAGGARSAPW